MFIGYDFFAVGNGAAFNPIIIYGSGYNKLQLQNGKIDDLYVEENGNLDQDTVRPTNWSPHTVLYATYDGNLEGGTITAGGIPIEKVRIQKREKSGVWQNVAEIPYRTPSENQDEDAGNLHEVIDRNIKSEYTYQYGLLPVTSQITGNRVVANELLAEFDGVYLSDNETNYQLIYDTQIGTIDHAMANSVFEPIDSKFPIVIYGNTDYTRWDVTALFVSPSTVFNNARSGNIDIKLEKMAREQLMRFLKNRKPKIYRDMYGNAKIVSVVGSPKEEPMANLPGIARVSFSLVEVAEFNDRNLAANGLLPGMDENYYGLSNDPSRQPIYYSI